MTGKYLINTDNWFVAPDGKQYKAVWGQVQIVNDSILGITTNRNSTNWFAMVGEGKKHVIIAGCQIHYAVMCEEKPNTEPAECWETKDGEIKTFLAPSRIYIAE